MLKNNQAYIAIRIWTKGKQQANKFMLGVALPAI
jgi:hypothetical protein